MTPQRPLPVEVRTMVVHDGDETTRSAIPGQEVCDFCLSTAVAWSYEAGYVELAPGHSTSDEWAACEGCHELIIADDREALVERSVAGIVDAEHPDLTRDEWAVAYSHMRDTVAQFMDTRGEGRMTQENR